jgi:hypothetical protein
LFLCPSSIEPLIVAFSAQEPTAHSPQHGPFHGLRGALKKEKMKAAYIWQKATK